jgi:hypothetical protein
MLHHLIYHYNNNKNNNNICISLFCRGISNYVFISNDGTVYSLNKITFIKASKGEKTIATLFCWSTAGS